MRPVGSLKPSRIPLGACGKVSKPGAERDQVMRAWCACMHPNSQWYTLPTRQRGDGGGTSSGRPRQTYHKRVQSKIHSLANLAAVRATCQPAAAARRSLTGPPRSAPHAATQRMPGCARGHGSAPPTAACRRAYAGGGPWWRISAFGLPIKGRRPRMTRAHDRQCARTRCPSGGARRARRSLAPRARSAMGAKMCERSLKVGASARGKLSIVQVSRRPGSDVAVGQSTARSRCS